MARADKDPVLARPAPKPKVRAMMRGSGFGIGPVLRQWFQGGPRVTLTGVPTEPRISSPPLDLSLEWEGLSLRAGQARDYVHWVRERTASRQKIIQWEPDWTDQDMTRAAFHQRLRLDERQWRAGRRFSFLVFDSQTSEILGGISLSDVRRGNRQSGVLGYWVGAAHGGRGVGSRAVAAVNHFAFHRLALNRVEAACQPGNLASRRVLEKNGFLLEGVMHRYLRINGRWCDHEIWGRVKP